MNEAKKMMETAFHAMSERQAIDPKILDISEISVLADYFMIASARNKNHLKALSEDIQDAMSKAGFEPKQIEGQRDTAWILMDYRDIIIHLFDEENRLYYDLERIWRDGKVITVEEAQD
ncbi:MAG: ribosome silencing factor [Lachnospiraceae bacterium]|nr:ribosome silencing factor [Lachnospiraceae bacterium]MDY5741773.1 ribosome silencing factor [Lachnospiraceae bacterium]